MVNTCWAQKKKIDLRLVGTKRLMIKSSETSIYYLTNQPIRRMTTSQSSTLQPSLLILPLKTFAWKPLVNLSLWALAIHSLWLENWNKCYIFLHQNLMSVDWLYSESGSQTWVIIVRYLSPVRLFVNPWTVACQAFPSSTISWSFLKFMFIDAIYFSW